MQLSLVDSLDASTHLAIGRALQGLDYANLLVIGSGFSFHNMRAFFATDTPEIRARNQAFEDWLEETCGDTALQESERGERLAHWERAPHARFCHPPGRAPSAIACVLRTGQPAQRNAYRSKDPWETVGDVLLAVLTDALQDHS